MSWTVAPAARRLEGTPAAPAFPERGGTRPGRGAGAGRGTERDRREAVSGSAGLAPRRHPKVLPTPSGPRPSKEGGHRPTTRPGREPCLTGLSLGGDEPADFRLATGPGTNEYRDRPGLCSPAQPPCSAGRGRRSPHECWVRLVRGLRGQEPRLPWISKPGRRPMAFAAAAVTPEKRRQRNAAPPWPWKIFSLDSENLMRVRRLTLRVRTQETAGPTSGGGVESYSAKQDFILQPEAEDKRLE